LTAALLLALAGTALAMPVEVTHPVADYLRRLEEKGVVEPGFWSTLPRDEAQVVRVLQQAQRNTARLSAWDRRRLERYLDEFDPVRRRDSWLHYEDGSPFVLHGSFEWYSGGFLRDSLPVSDHHGFGSYRGTAQVRYGDFAWATASAGAGSERHLHDRFVGGFQFDPAMGLPYAVGRDGLDGYNQSGSSFDAARVVVGLGNTHLRVEVGQDWNQWGPGRWQHATLGARPHFWIADAPPARPGTGYAGSAFPGSHRRGYRYPGEGPPMPQVRLRIGSSNWEYTKVVASRTGLWKDSLATLFAQRLQVRLGDVKIAASEMTAIGTRRPNAVYYLPGIPLRVAEHESGDQDNAAMAFDAEWTVRGHGRVYGELLVDDFSGPPLDFWGNKLAWTVGGSWQDPLGWPLEVQAEYAHVDPWVYGHHEFNAQFQSYGALLGSSLPPNSRALRGALLFPLPGGLEGALNGLWRQRDLKSPGSSIFDGKPALVGDTDELKDFLARDVETRTAVELDVTWLWRRYVTVSLGAGGLWVTNFRGEAGDELTTPPARCEVTLRY
jgi:hypothetical protein